MDITKHSDARKYRFITIALMFTIVPLGIYRLWVRDDIYRPAEKITYTMISCVYVIALIGQLI